MKVIDIYDKALFEVTVAVRTEEENGFHSPSEEEMSMEVKKIDVRNDIIILII